jgi:ABC-type Na+ efflux pump permease subunit
MAPATKALRKSLRVVWAIASKDIVDALKNKTTLINIIIVFLVMVAYK